MKRFTIMGFILGMTLMVVVCAFGAGVPQVINYSGTLTNKVGAAVPDGTYDIEFNIYNVPSAGVSLWTEKWGAAAIPSSPVLVTGGVFNVMLGTISPFPNGFFADNPNTYLGIKVGADSEMLPRQKIASVGYAFAAGNGVPKGGVIMWSGVTIPDGWALCNGSNGTPDLRDKFIMGAGSTYAIGATGGSATHTHAGVDHLHGYSGITSDTPATEPAGGGGGSTVANSTHSHSYSGSTGAADRSLTTGSTSTFPPYYALAFIMKL